MAAVIPGIHYISTFIVKVNSCGEMRPSIPVHGCEGGGKASAATQPVIGEESTRAPVWHSRHDTRHSEGRCQTAHTHRASLVRLNKKMLFLFLITGLSTVIMSCKGNLAHQSTQWQWSSRRMNYVLRKVMAGPLQGKRVVLMADDSLIQHMEGGSVLGAAATQTVILSFPWGEEDNSTDLYLSIKPRKTYRR